MKLSVWFFISSLCLISANGEINDNVSKSHETLETSSANPNQPLMVMKEYVLYLTPEQAQTLQANGAIVKPLPQYEHALQKPYYKQSIQDHVKPLEQKVPTNEDSRVDVNLDEIKVLHVQPINDDLVVQSPTTDKYKTTITKPRSKYKYSSRPRQEYGLSNVAKKSNKTKSSSAEYVRYLPNYEIEVLKMEPFRTQPMPGYYLDDAQTTLDVQTQSPNAAEINLNPKEPPRHGDFSQPSSLQIHEKILEYKTVAIEKPLQKQDDIQIHSDFKNPIEIPRQEKISNQEGIQLQEELQKESNIKTGIQSLASIQRLEEIHSGEQIPTGALSIEYIRNHQSIATAVPNSMNSKGPVTFDGKASDPIQDSESDKHQAPVKSETSSLAIQEKLPSQQLGMTPSAAAHMQYTSLLNPLLQHQQISDSIAQHKDLINSQQDIQTKLRQLKNNGEEYSMVLDKLKQNLEKQNILAEKLATQSFLKKPQGLGKEELTIRRRRPLELVHGLEPSSLIIPRPYPVSWGVDGPGPIPVENKPVILVDAQEAISIPKPRYVYSKAHTPYLTQEDAPDNAKHETLPTYPFHQPENLRIVRPIWEH